MKASDLKRTIDRMVAESIRRLLPEIMNEVLLRTIASSGIVNEAPAPQPVARPSRSRRQPSTSLSDLLDESAGSEFYRKDDYVARAEPAPQLTQRLSELSPELRSLAEDTVRHMDDEPPGSVDLRAAAGAGFDFARMRESLGLVEQKAPKPLQKDPAMEERRIARLREQLEVKPGN